MASFVVNDRTLQRRRSLIRWSGAMLLVVRAFSTLFRLSRPTIVVGQSWPLSERVMYANISHQRWNELLHRYVDADGNVDYAAWKGSAADLGKLDEYLASLSRLDESRHGRQSPRCVEERVHARTLMTILRVHGLDCADEAAELREALPWPPASNTLCESFRGVCCGVAMLAKRSFAVVQRTTFFARQFLACDRTDHWRVLVRLSALTERAAIRARKFLARQRAGVRSGL